MERPPVVYASNHDVAPGAFPVHSARNTASSRTFMSPMSSNETPRAVSTNEESKQEEGVTSSAAAGIGLYTVEAQWVPDGNEDGTVIYAEAQYVSTIDDRDVAHAASVGDLKILEHAPPSEPMQLPAGLGMVDLMGRPPVDLASNHDVAPGAFPVRSARNTATIRTFRSPIRSHDSPREFANEESEQEEGVTTFAAAGVTVAETEQLRKKWYQHRWIFVALSLCACGFAVAVVVIVVPIVLTRPSGTSSEQIACNFINQPNLSKCRSTDKFITAYAPPGTTIPTEIGLLTQLTSLSLYEDVYIGTIPSEVGLLTHLSGLSFSNTELRGTIPSTIGNLAQLTFLEFSNSGLTGSIPSSFERFVQLHELYITSNPISGSVPSWITTLTDLTYLSLYDTSLTGSIPSSFCSQANLTLIDCEKIECTCCNAFADDDSVDKPACA